jgi:putative hydrolase of the HAD superfamily
MKYQAVIFDLFGTLIDKLSMIEHTAVLRHMASVLFVPSDDFIRLWFDTFEERGLGFFKTLDDNIEYICRRLQTRTDGASIKLAVEINRNYTAHAMKLRPYAMEVLSYLKSHDYKVGLITDCSAEVPKLLKNLPFAQMIDVAIFSALVGMQKPDPRIYRLAAERLAVEPAVCLYIGDGDSYELTGASRVGMHPILIRDLKENSSDVYRVNAEANEWHGIIISSLNEVLDLVK